MDNNKSAADQITILEESLVKKIDLLRQIKGLNEEQKIIFENDDSTPDELDNNLDKKSAIIERLDKMDEGFQSLFDKVKPEIENNREAYADQIKRMQESIRTIADLTASIQAEESRNKELAKHRFSYIRSQIKETRANQKAVASYYNSMMNNTGYEGSQFWDKKK